MSITLPDGTAYIHTGEIVNVADREYFQQSMEGKTYISNLVESKVDLRKANVYSVPIVRDGKVVGVVWASILTEDFYQKFHLGNISQFGDVFLIDKLGNLIAQEDSTLIDYNFFDLINETGRENQKQLQQMEEDFENLEDNYQLFKYRDNANYIYYSKLNYSDWWILTKVPIEKLNTMNRSVLIVTIGVSIALILVSSIGFMLFFLTTKKSNNQLKSIAYTDSVTGGKNDIFLKTNLEKIINKKGNFAFISLEIINIKPIINILGIKNAQLLLKEIYDLISKMLKKEEVVVHSYLGEYKIVLKYDDITELIERLNQVAYYKNSKNIDFKLGVYLIEKSDSNFEDMCLYVNIAKESLTNNHKYAFYSKSIHEKEINKIKLEEDIKHGIVNKEFKAWFQPKYGKDGKTILGAEALVRWYKHIWLYNLSIYVYTYL